MQEYFPTPTKNGNLGGKLIILALLMGAILIATMFVWTVVQDREGRQEEAANEVSAQWSRPQVVAGPVLTIPVEKTSVTTTGERVVNTMTLTLLPKTLAYESEVETELRARGVYETPVYTTTVKGSGSFDLRDIGERVSTDTRILWDEAVISLNVSDPRGISSMFDLILGGKALRMLPSSEFTTLSGSGVHANIVLTPTEPELPFSFALPLRGSRELSFLPLGENTGVRVRSSWGTPSFTGEFLPETRTVTASGFDASWRVTSYGMNLPQSWLGSSVVANPEALLSKAFGVALYEEVSFYTMVDRSIKYSILFIALTFLTFFMYEMLAGLRIHPMQYLLVGLAIALFYLLLLSFAELIGFLPAYLVAAVATTLLITGYCASVLKARRRALAIAALLTALYGYLYILLQLDEYSLLFGSVLLFSVLTTVMYLTRNLDWYR